MGKTVGQAIGTVAGGVAGFVFGGGFYGAIQGASLGYSLGTMADPPDLPSTQGPRLDDKQFQSSEYGTGIPLIYGDIALRGNVIYLENGEYKEVARKQTTGGKGSAPKQEHTTYTYYATFAVALSEAIPGAAIRRIWLGSKLVYNVDSNDLATQIQSSRFAAGGDGWLDGGGQASGFTEDQLSQGGAAFQFYDGSQTEPDPRIESVLGVGNCPAYTGTAYIMFYDLDLTDYGNNLAGAQVKVEIVKQTPTASLSTLEEIVNTFSGGTAEENCYYITPQKVKFTCIQNTFTTLKSLECTPFGAGSLVAEPVPTISVFNSTYVRKGLSDTTDFSNFYHHESPYGCPINSIRFQLKQGVFATFSSTQLAICQNVYASAKVWASITAGYTPRGVTIGDNVLYVVHSVSSSVTINTYDFDLNLLDSWAAGGVNVGVNSRVWYDSGWVYISPTITSNPLTLRRYHPATQTVGDFWSITHTTPLSTGNNDAYKMAVFGNIAITTNYRGSQIFRAKFSKLFSFDRNGEPLDEIVEDLINRSGVSDSSIDLSALSSDTVRGFLASMPGSVRANLTALQTAFLFDLIEDGYTLKAVKRGGSSVATITQEELDARALGARPGVKVLREIEMNNRLPSRYTLTYIDYNREYENNSQTAEFSTNTENKRAETLPVVLNSNEAIQIADVLGRIAWIERHRVSFALSLEYVDLLPSDIVSLETSEDVFEDVRIEEKTELEDQRVQISGRITDASIYTSTLIGMDGSEPDQTITFVGESTFIGLDIPMLLDSTDEYGLIAAMYGPGNYPGGVLMYSLDGGQTYEQLQAWADAVAVGIATNSLSSNECYLIDRTSSLNISVKAGAFTGITETQMMTGQNYVAYGDDGRWEIMQFAGSTLQANGTYTLDTFVRGLKGTEQYTGTHAVGDKVVLLTDPDLAFIDMDSSDVGVSRSYKPVTVGQQTEYVDEVSFTYNAINLKCLSGVHAIGLRDGSNNWNVTWTGRTRYNSSYWTTGSQPDNEDTLSFEVDIMNGSSVVRTLTSSTTSVTYTSAQQTTDFGGVQSSIEVNIYQIANTGLRGYALNDTFSV